MAAKLRVSLTYAAFLGAQVVLLALILIPVGVSGGWRRCLPGLLGGAVSLMNSVGLVYAWPRLLEKKDVALAFGVIVSKFAISIGIVYWLTRPATREWLGFGSTGLMSGFLGNPLAVFAAGIGVVIPAAVVAAWIESRKE